MNQVLLKDRYGKNIIFDREALSGLRTDDIERLQAGESITYRNKEYILKSMLDDGTAYYVEKTSWMDKHPLVQLDQQLRSEYGQGKIRASTKAKRR